MDNKAVSKIGRKMKSALIEQSNKRSSKKTKTKRSSKKTKTKRSSKKSKSYYSKRMSKQHPGYKVAKRSKAWSKRGKAKESSKILPPVSDDIVLGDYGYTLQKPKKERQSSLKRASKKNNTLAVLRRVNLIRNYSKSVPLNYKKLSDDVEFLKKEYKKQKESK